MVEDAGLVADMEPGAADAAPESMCRTDADCGERAYCAEDGRCIAAPAVFRPDVPFDGVTRAGAARFDLTPDFIETWVDRAGPECPNNRPGRYDGDLYTPKPADPCIDGFDDTNANGFFDGVWLAGAGLDRPANGVEAHNPPEGRVVVLVRDETVHVIVSLDLFAIDAARLDALGQRFLQRLGLSPSQLTVHTTGVRTAPDAVGLWGPSLSVGARAEADPLTRLDPQSMGLLADLPVRSGVNGAWWNQIVDRTLSATRQAGVRVSPVQVQIGEGILPIPAPPMRDGPIELPDANGNGVLNDAQDRAAWHERPQALARDDSFPSQTDRKIRVIALQAPESGMQRIVLVGWGAAPNTVPAHRSLLSADFPGEVRKVIEARYPRSVAVWLTSVAPDTLRAGSGAFIPAVSDIGQPVNVDGEPVEAPLDAARAMDPTAALGQLVAYTAIKGLAGLDAVPAQLAVEGRYAWVPITNPRFGLAARLGLLGPLGDWLLGIVPTTGWAPAAEAPSCGGLGCLRYRVDRIQLAGNLALLTMPGAPLLAYAAGRPQSSMDFGDQRNLRDLDGDGVFDVVDDDLSVGARVGETEVQVNEWSPVNPQRFAAIRGLGSDSVWPIGRTNGGVGSLGSRGEHVNVFEGQLDGLYTRLDDPLLADLSLEVAGYAPRGDLTVAALVESAFEEAPHRLANLPTSFELLLERSVMQRTGVRWRLESSEGDPIFVDDRPVEGDDLTLGPGFKAYTPHFNFARLGPLAGDQLILVDAGESLAVDSVMPIVVRKHPNAGDTWNAIAPDGGDFVYNTACEVLFDGACPNRIEVSPDPNTRLPRMP